MSKKLILNFFGELSSINLPINLSSLKILISDLYQFSATETEEIIIYYILNNNEILISSEEDYKKFLLTNINQIYLNISQNSQIYKTNFNIINEEMTQDKKKLDELFKKYNGLLETSKNKFTEEKKKVQEILKKISELENQKKQIESKIIEGHKLIEKEIFETKKQIVELQKKLKIPISFDLNESCQDINKLFNFQKNEKIDNDIKEIANWMENVFGKIKEITNNFSDNYKIDENLKCLFQNKFGKIRNYEPIFHTGLNYTTEIYNISKYPLPKNFEVKLYFDSVSWIRIGITFDKKIIDNQIDKDCPQYDIYYLLEDLQNFYCLKNNWRKVFNNNLLKLKNGSYLIMSMKNGKLKYKVNDVELDGFIEVDFKNKGDMYILVHARNNNSKCSIISISEISD